MLSPIVKPSIHRELKLNLSLSLLQLKVLPAHWLLYLISIAVPSSEGLALNLLLHSHPLPFIPNANFHLVSYFQSYPRFDVQLLDVS